MGVLTDGKALAPPLAGRGGGPARFRPYAFTLEDVERLDSASTNGCATSPSSPSKMSRPDRDSITAHFGPGQPRLTSATSPSSRRSTGRPRPPRNRPRQAPQLWYDLLRTALGEIAYTTESMSADAQAQLAAVRRRTRRRWTTCSSVTPTSAPSSAWWCKPRSASTSGGLRRQIDPADLLAGAENCSRATGLAGRARIRLLRVAERGHRRRPACCKPLPAASRGSTGLNGARRTPPSSCTRR